MHSTCTLQVNEWRQTGIVNDISWRKLTTEAIGKLRGQSYHGSKVMCAVDIEADGPLSANVLNKFGGDANGAADADAAADAGSIGGSVAIEMNVDTPDGEGAVKREQEGEGEDADDSDTADNGMERQRPDWPSRPGRWDGAYQDTPEPKRSSSESEAEDEEPTEVSGWRRLHGLPTFLYGPHNPRCVSHQPPA